MKKLNDRYDTIIIGGSQSGLATGYFLKRQGRDFVILDEHDRIGDAWRTRWDSLRLFTPARLSSLPGMTFPAAPNGRPTKDEMADYLEGYVTQFELPVQTGVRVEQLTREGDKYIVRTADQRIEADNVVVATGGYNSPKIPEFASELNPDINQIHSTQYQRPSQLQEGSVLVVGAANSGAEIALEAATDHTTWLSGRHPGTEPMFPEGGFRDTLFTTFFWFVLSNVLTVKTPIGRKLKPKLTMHGLPLGHVKPDDLEEAGVNRVYARTVGTRNGLPVLEDGRVLDVANVVWCTGFKPNYEWIKLPGFDAKGLPRHERGVVTSEPGLYFVGLLFQTAATSSLVGGVGRDAAYIADQLAARSKTRTATANNASPAIGKPNMAR